MSQQRYQRWEPTLQRAGSQVLRIHWILMHMPCASLHSGKETIVKNLNIPPSACQGGGQWVQVSASSHMASTSSQVMSALRSMKTGTASHPMKRPPEVAGAGSRPRLRRKSVRDRPSSSCSSSMDSTYPKMICMAHAHRIRPSQPTPCNSLVAMHLQPSPWWRPSTGGRVSSSQKRSQKVSIWIIDKSPVDAGKDGVVQGAEETWR